ncbi:serine hydrolase [Actinosynnema sp. NPDC023587]|uniref:serine hydrolase n=1 Tax=Actinosynnema sp. NPDC023587 TaxID=3154695 RepID=UPI0033E4E8DC
MRRRGCAARPGEGSALRACTGFYCSNTDYLLAGMVIEAVTGRTWQQEVTEWIIRPLGLRNTSALHKSPFISNPHVKGYGMFAGKGIDMGPPIPDGASGWT